MEGIVLKMAKRSESSASAAADTPRAPRHVAVIMDGNGRWAKERGLPRIMGHRRGAEMVREIFGEAFERGIEFLTLYAFSSENWNRPKEEVGALMGLLLSSLKKYGEDFVKRQIRFRTIGDVEKLPHDCVRALGDLREKTAQFSRGNLVLALNYGSRDELVRAVSKMCARGVANPSWGDLADSLDTAGIPDPDFLIRTSGEMRLSNFLMLQAAYAELYFTDVYWPDFDRAEFGKALDEYARRERRYGLTSEQLGKK